MKIISFDFGMFWEDRINLINIGSAYSSNLTPKTLLFYSEFSHDLLLLKCFDKF